MGPEEKKLIEEAPAGIIHDVAPYNPRFFHDESRLAGDMKSISFPRDEEEIKAHIESSRSAGLPVTIQGMRTGITGGAVPEGGHALNLNKMTRILGLRRDEASDHFFMTLQPGVFLREQIWPATTVKDFDTSGWSDQSLDALKVFRAAPPYLFPPDPSEPTISLGGMVANNASGARSFHYGPTRAWVERLRVVLADGSTIDVRRSDQKASGRQGILVADSSCTIEFQLPGYTTPNIKTSAGYFSRENMDLIDLFIGSEGTLGVISEIEVRLIPEPRFLDAAMIFFKAEENVIDFVTDIRGAEYRPTALEWYDHNSVEFIRSRASVFTKYQNGHEIPDGPCSAIYYEYHSHDADEAKRALEQLIAVARKHQALTEQTWMDRGMDALKNYKQIKHHLPECVNGIVSERQRSEPRLRKLGTDFSVPDHRLHDLMAVYHRDLDDAGFEHLIFGHLGDNNLHVNIVPRSHAEYQRGQEIYLEWAKAAVEMGGTVSAEHGIGKIKKSLARVMFSDGEIAEMRQVKQAFDPEMMLNRGNMFDP